MNFLLDTDPVFSFFFFGGGEVFEIFSDNPGADWPAIHLKKNGLFGS